MAKLKVSINGFGRIGRVLFRAGFDNLDIVAINDLSSLDTVAHLLKYDSTHGIYKNDVHTEGQSLVVNGKKINVCAVKNPAELPWKANEVDVVLECTGAFKKKEQFLEQIKAGAKKVFVSVDGTGRSSISTGLAFFDHMLEQIAKHGSIDLNITAKGDLHIDEHHTIEDVGIALGEAFLKALNNKMGIERYGFLLPMDDCLAQVAIDFGGRNWIMWEADFKREKIGEMPTEMFFHFFKSFSDASKSNLNIKAEGQNEHHKIEAIFKAFAKAIKMAIKRDANNMNLPSTKGVL